MNNQFDELAKGLTQMTSRRQALKKFGGTLAGMALTCFGLTSTGSAKTKKGCLEYGSPCTADGIPCCSGLVCQFDDTIGVMQTVCMAPGF